MAKKRIDIELGFSANTNQAKNALKQLQSQLDQISMGKGFELDQGFTQEIQNGIEAASRLNAVLKSATNVQTGKLDLGKFQQSLKQSGMSLTSLRENLQDLGPAGDQAFLDLAKSINMAEVPVLRINDALRKMGQTLANTMRWQISSSILQGFQGALQNALGFAEDLNESLNDIRIVTGYSAEEMDKFAIKANKAAKALSTTTTEYTKASLIYFQQGLSNAEVEKRTQTTIKLANVTGENAQTVSEWMTAVWNNFDNGSKSLEYYADVMTALGAVTASSSEEIAQGLEKFAAIADTIGLSYEYAASALATVTAQTRQSADVVGTAFKTIFARMEGLTLGEQLEDGTDLNKYSQALKTVGVDIINTSGQLKDMDTILNDLGARWQFLSQAQKVALAQTVGGMRQYNQLIALMDNWDTFQTNLSTSLGASGTLEEQASIYAESWEAARDRVTAAAETIYAELLDDDAFIKLLDFFADFLEFLDKTIDSIGGLRGVLLLLGSVITSVFSEQMAAGLSNTGLFLKSLTKAGRQTIEDQKQQVWDEARKMPLGAGGSRDPVINAQTDAFEREMKIEELLYQSMKGRSQLEQDIYRQKANLVKLQQQEHVEAEKAKKEAQERLKIEQDLLETAQKEQKRLVNLKVKAEKGLSNASSEESSARWKEKLNDINSRLVRTNKEVEVSAERVANAYNDVEATTNKAKQATKDAKTTYDNFKQSMDELTPVTYKTSEVIVGVANAAMQMSFAFNSIASIGDILKDEDLSPWEQFTSILLTISSIIPIIVKASQLFNDVTLKNTIIKIANVLATKQQTKAQKEYKESLDDSTNSIKKNTAAETADTVQEVVKDGITYRRRVTSKGTQYFQVGKRGSITADLGKKIFGEATAGTGQISSTITKVGPALIKILSIIGPIAIGIAAIGITIGSIVKDLNKHNEAAKKARKAANDLKKAYETTKNAYDNLTSTVTSYEEASKGLKELTRGTLEFKEALVKTNDQAFALINQYDSLAGKWYTNKDGLIVFDEGALEDLQSLQLSKTLATQNASLQADYEADIAEFEAEKIEALRDIRFKGERSIGQDLLQIYKSGATQSGIAFVKTIGTIIGEAVTGIVTEEEQQALKDLEEEYLKLETVGNQILLKENLETVLQAKGYDEELIKSFEENKESIYDLIKSQSNLQKANESLELQIAKNVNSGQAWYDTSNYQDTWDVITVNEQNKEEINLTPPSAATIRKESFQKESETFNFYKSIAKTLGIDLSDSLNPWVKSYDIANTYFRKEDREKIQEAYITDYLKGTPGKDFKFDKDGYLITLVTDSSGITTESKSEEKFSPIDLLEQLYNYNQYGLTEDERKIYSKQLAEWEKRGITDNTFLSALYSNNITGTVSDLSQYTQEEIEKKLIPAMIEILGLSEEEAREKLKPALDNYSKELSELQSKSKKRGFSAGSIDLFEDSSYNLNELQKIIEAGLQSTLLSQSAESAFLNVLKTIDSKELEAAISDLAINFDFTSPFAYEQFIDQLKTMGFTVTKEAIPAVEAYIIAMQKAANATAASNTSVRNLTNDLIAAKKILKETEIGSIISEKDYEILKKINPAIKDFFAETAEGFILLTDGAELYQDKFSNSVIDTLKDTIQQGYSINEAVKKYINQTNTLYNKETNSLNTENIINDALAIKEYLSSIDQNILAAAGINNIDAISNDLETLQTALNDVEKVMANSVLGEYNPELALNNVILEEIKTIDELLLLFEELNLVTQDRIKLYNKYEKYILSVEEAEKERIEDLKQEYGEVYRLNRAIQNQNRAINEVNEAANRAWGPHKTALLNKQSKLYDDLVSKNKALAAELEKQLQIKQQTDALKFGENISFNGLEISDWNFDGLGAEAQQELTDFIDEYNSILDQMYDAAEAAAQAARDAFDAKLEGLQYTIECEVEIQDYQLDELERLFEKLEDKSFSTAEQIANLSEQAGLLNKKTEAYAGMQDKIFKQFGAHSWDELMSMEGVDQQAIMDLLGATLEELKEIRDTLYDMDKQIADKLVEAFQEWGEEFDKLNARAERFNSIINSYQNIVNLTRQFTDMDSEIVKNLANASVEVAKTEMEILKNKWETLRDEKKKIDDALALTDTQLEELYGTNDPMGTRDYWQARLEEINEMIEQAQVEYLGSWENALQVAADAYQTIMGEIFRDFEKQMTGSFGSFEAMEKYYDQQSKLQELWLKDYEKIYELTKLNRKLSQDIDETDNIKAKKELRKLQEEINRLQESDTKLSKYDLEYLQKRYDLKLAEIALEEAQRAKGNVQLARNASGGWGYVYTADEDKIADAEQKLEDVIFDIQKFGNETILQLGQQITQLKGEWAQALEEIYSSGLTGEELEKALETTNEYYKTTIEDLSTQFDKALAANSSLFDTTFQSDTANLLAQGKGFVTAFDDTIVAGLGDGKTSGSYKTMTDNTKAFIDAIGTAGTEADSPGTGLLGELQSNYNQFRTTADAILNLAGTDFKDLGRDINTHIGTPGSGEDNPGTGILGDLEKLKAAYADLKQKIQDENKAIIENLTKWKLDSALIYSAVVAEIEKVEAAAKLAKEAIDDLANAEAGADTGGGGPIILPGDEDKEENEKTSTGENDWRIGGVYAFGSMLNTGKFNNMYEVQDWFNEQSETNGYYFNEAERNALIKEAEKRGLNWEHPTLPSGTIGGALSSVVTSEIKNKPNISNSSVGQNSSALGFKEDRLDEEFGTFSIGDSVTTGAYGVATYDILIDPKTGERTANTGRYHTAHASGKITDKDFINGEWYYLVDGDWVPGKNLSSMGTGGYTGAWGPEGRLAILHEKEIVLNKEDTANFLSALGILDSIVSMIDLQAASRAADASLLKTHGFISGAQSLEQQVTIHAEFPNATDHNEIEEAFNNLINKASQYANRKQ